MFKKLLGSLPFNPSLIHQVGFYAKRLRQETAIRRWGVVLMVLTLAIQLFAIIEPPSPSLARAGNDIIPGGFSTQAEGVNHCNNNDFNYKIMLNYFGISCAAMFVGSVRRIDYSEFGGQLYSMGRLPYGFAGETAVNIPYAGTFYMRPLTAWGPHCIQDGKNCLAIVGHRSDGTPFMALFSCGNIVIVGPPKPPAPPPPPPPAPKPPAPPKPCPYNSALPTTDSRCKPCDKSQNQNDTTACLILSKTAANLTNNGQNADGTTAHAGDTIQYTLRVKNTGKATVKKFVIQENLTDVLEYADLVDLHGGSKDAFSVASWPAVDVPAQTTVTRLITVRIKNPIPQTPTPPSNPGSFDMTMTNVYGNVVNIKLPPTIVKTTEQVTTTALPNTGPGASLVIGFSLTAIMAYFFARSRLMGKELAIVRSDYASGGF